MQQKIEDVLKVVKAHNYAWSVLKDLEEQKKYVHTNVVFLAPPYDVIRYGIDQYLTSYKEWMEHARVHHFTEINPDVKFYNNGMFAIVTYEIDMAFDYDDKNVPDWHGVDQMTLVFENGKWLITSDMYARHLENE